MVNYYSAPRKICKWYKKVILHFLDIAVWNTYFVYKKKFNTENIKFKDFRDILIKHFISLSTNVTNYEIYIANKNKKGRATPKNVPESSHFQEHIPIPQGYKRKKYYTNCVYCYSLNIKRRKHTYLRYKKCVKRCV